MNIVKKNEAKLEKEIRRLKKENDQLRSKVKDLTREVLIWKKTYNDLHEHEYGNRNRKPCDHKFVDTDFCVKCGWKPE